MLSHVNMDKCSHYYFSVFLSIEQKADFQVLWRCQMFFILELLEDSVCVHICVCMLTHTTDQSCLWILMQNPSMKYHQIKCSSTLNNYHDEVGYITGMWAWCNTGESSLQKRKLYMVISTGAKNALLKFNIQWYIDWVSGYLTVYICQNSLSCIL